MASSTTFQCVAAYAFKAESSHEVSFAAGDKLKVVKAPPDKLWWLVETVTGQRGYAPSTYLGSSRIPLASGATTSTDAGPKGSSLFKNIFNGSRKNGPSPQKIRGRIVNRQTSESKAHDNASGGTPSIQIDQRTALEVQLKQKFARGIISGDEYQALSRANANQGGDGFNGAGDTSHGRLDEPLSEQYSISVDSATASEFSNKNMLESNLKKEAEEERAKNELLQARVSQLEQVVLCLSTAPSPTEDTAADELDVSLDTIDLEGGDDDDYQRRDSSSNQTECSVQNKTGKQETVPTTLKSSAKSSRSKLKAAKADKTDKERGRGHARRRKLPTPTMDVGSDTDTDDAPLAPPRSSRPGPLSAEDAGMHLYEIAVSSNDNEGANSENVYETIPGEQHSTGQDVDAGTSFQHSNGQRGKTLPKLPRQNKAVPSQAPF